MPTPLTTLIDKLDTSEIIRDQIASILVVESAEQMRLAALAAKDPERWRLRVYTERATPWQSFRETPDRKQLGGGSVDASPIVNVWFDNESFDESASDIHYQQRADGIFNVDVYGYGIAETSGSGHLSADEVAAREAQRAMRIVRNVIMSAPYAYLGLTRGSQQLIERRFPRSITAFQPEEGAVPVQRVQGIRLALSVWFQEYAPDYEGELLSEMTFQVLRAPDGQMVLAESTFFTE